MSSLALGPLSSNALDTKPKAAAASPTGGPTNSNANQTSVSSLGATFMSLLVQELQNQDPTSPMDSTQMVGQMVSLNQLDQLASINDLLTKTLGAQAPTTATGNDQSTIAAAK